MSIKDDVWNIMRSSYNIKSETPQSDAQEAFLGAIVEYVSTHKVETPTFDLKAPNFDIEGKNLSSSIEITTKRGRGRPKGSKNRK